MVEFSQQFHLSIGRGAVICFVNILLSVVLCTTLKSYGKFYGKLCLVGYFVLNSAQSSGNSQELLEESLSSVLCIIIPGKGSYIATVVGSGVRKFVFASHRCLPLCFN